MKSHGNKQSRMQTSKIMKKLFVLGLLLFPVLVLAVPPAPEPVPEPIPEGTTVISFQYDAMGNRISQSNPTADSDGDGILDAWELEHFGNLTHDMSLDTDNDGLTDLDEYNALTNPTLADTDGDGINDGFELNNGMNPLDVADALIDSDSDGLPDAFEIFHGLNINDAADANTDADGDGFTVLQEFRASTSDNDANKYPPIIVDFESGEINPFYWQYEGNSSWYVTNENVITGSYSLKAGNVSNDETSVIALTINATGEPMSFDLLVDTESDQDRLKFYIDDVLQNEWFGDSLNAHVEYSLSPGKRQLKWVYQANATVAVTNNKALNQIFSDNSANISVYVPPEPAIGVIIDNIKLPTLVDGDNDDIDDSWEYLYFDNLNHDMSLDSDGDGLTDFDEYQAGKNPLIVDELPVSEFPEGLIANGDFETGNDFNPRNANVPLSFETDNPIKGLRSLKGSANGYDYITYSHTDFATTGTNLTNVNLSGFIQASRRMRVTVRVSYVGGTWSTSSSGYQLTPKTGEQVELLLDVPIDNLREVSNIKLTIASDGTAATPTEFIIDNIQLQIE